MLIEVIEMINRLLEPNSGVKVLLLCGILVSFFVSCSSSSVLSECCHVGQNRDFGGYLWFLNGELADSHEGYILIDRLYVNDSFIFVEQELVHPVPVRYQIFKKSECERVFSGGAKEFADYLAQRDIDVSLKPVWWYASYAKQSINPRIELYVSTERVVSKLSTI